MKYFLIYIALLLSNSIYSQIEELKCIQNLTIEDGLSHDGVTCILEDRKGYIWIGTYDGLNRYDGYDFKVFKNSVDNYFLPSIRIRSLCDDNNGNIWIGTDEGLVFYNYQKEMFQTIYSSIKNYHKQRGPIIRKVFYNQKHNFIVGFTEDGEVLTFYIDGRLNKHIKFPENFLADDVFINECSPLGVDKYLISTSLGLFVYDVNTSRIEKIVNEVNSLNSACFVADSLILGASNNGIVQIGVKKTSGAYQYNFQKIFFEGEQFKYLSVDLLGKLWLVFAEKGLYQIDNVDAFINQLPYSIKKYTNPDIKIRGNNLYQTNKHGCWFTTFNKGIFRFDQGGNPFKTIKEKVFNGQNYSFNQMTMIVPMDRCRVLVEANDRNIVIFNTESNQIEDVSFEPIRNRAYKIANAFKDSKGNIWLNDTSNGLSYVKAGTKKAKPIHLDNMKYYSHSQIRSIQEDRKGNIWFGGIDGVIRVNVDKYNNIRNVEFLNDHEYFNYQKLKVVWELMIDPIYDFVWIGTATDGLFRIEVGSDESLDEAKISQFKVNLNQPGSITSNFVTSIVRLPDSTMWLGTEGGGDV